MTTMRLLLTLSFLFLLTHCAHQITQNPCPIQDWYEYGRQYGAVGKTLENIDTYDDLCTGINKSYLIWGWKKGISEYCSPENGLSLGKNGDIYTQNCPTELEDDFLKKYALGLKIFELKKNNTQLNEILRSLLEKMQTPSMAPQEKAQLSAQIQSLEHSMTQNNQKMNQLEQVSQ